MLNCDHLCFLCRFLRSVFHFFPHVTFIWVGQVVSCEGARGNVFELDHLRQVVSKMLSCDCLCTLCMFVQPVCHFLPRAFDVRAGQVRSGARVMEPKEMRSGRVVLYCEGAQGNTFGQVGSSRVMASYPRNVSGWVRSCRVV